MFKKTYLLVSGCSHTVGVGINPKNSWSQHVAKSLNLNLINLAASGACAKFVATSIIDWMSHASSLPEIMVVQWPNPYRTMKVENQKTYFYNVNSMDQDFAHRFKYDSESFVREWQDSIIDLNSKFGTKLINLCLESNDNGSVIQSVQDLLDQGIVLHIDEKIPNKTWHFDSRAADNLHHSEYCHERWAARVLTIINKQR